MLLHCLCLLGIFLGNTKSQSAVIQAVTFSAFLLSLLMSGFIYPVANIPIGILIANFVPARSYILLTRDALPGVWAGL